MASQAVVLPDDTRVRVSGARTQRTGLHAVAILLLVFAIYNANGREIASFDSQPAKLAAIELAHHHSLTLDNAVLLAPALAGRPGFVRSRDGHFRSAYPALPSLVAAGVASLLQTTRLVDLSAPRASALVAKLTASMLVAFAVVAAFLVARRRVDATGATLVAVGFGLGTNLWASGSQTLWQTETSVAALMASLLCLDVPVERLSAGRLWLASTLLGLAGAARPQLAPALAVVAVSIAVRRRRALDGLALLPLAVAVCTVAAFNLRWFGSILGAVPLLEAQHPAVHNVVGSFGNPIVASAGLLFSPSRGLLVFSPIVLVAAFALPALRRGGRGADLRWWAGAAVAQFALYANYSVWWAGNTYGPRYCLDLLPWLVPLAASGLPALLALRWRRYAAALALAWSVALAATGAFVYPNEQWNQDPGPVDRHHERLWEWRDPQFVRCWRSSWSPQNFSLFTRSAIRRDPAPPGGRAR